LLGLGLLPEHVHGGYQPIVIVFFLGLKQIDFSVVGWVLGADETVLGTCMATDILVVKYLQFGKVQSLFLEFVLARKHTYSFKVAIII
jgi:hypothetical protein